MPDEKRAYNDWYTGEFLSRVAFPLGGIGAGMFSIEGSGALSQFSLRNRPAVHNEPMVFAGLYVKDSEAGSRVLEGPVPTWKAFGMPGSANGQGGKTWGLPRFKSSVFMARFPFASVGLEQPGLPLQCKITAWSPFIPNDPDNCSLPVAALEYSFKNASDKEQEAVFSYNAHNFMATGQGASVKGIRGGFALCQAPTEEKPQDEGAFAVTVLGDEPRVNLHWFRGGWFDPLTIAWKNVRLGNAVEAAAPSEGNPSPGASLYVPFTLGPNETKTIRLLFSWYVPVTIDRHGSFAQDCEAGCGCEPAEKPTYKPWYASKFSSIEEVTGYWHENYGSLRAASEKFRDCLFDSTLPQEVQEAVTANLSILKSPTVLRQTDGRLWAFEGCTDESGCCSGSCTHVWNYQQALPNLLASLERTLRQTEFTDSQNEEGHQNFRSTLPIMQVDHSFHAASDGQLGGIIKMYREWRISGDTDWLRGLWPEVRKSLDYCIRTWDPRHVGALEEPHHNTYDIEFWGPDGMCTSFYLGALKAACDMGKALGDDVTLYAEILEKGCRFMETELWNGEYFNQKIQWQGLTAQPPLEDPGYSTEARELLKQEGPKYQYGNGCLSDAILGAWLAKTSGLEDFLDSGKVKSTLKSIHKYNLKKSLADHANPQRPTFALGFDGGLLLCSWPHGDQLSLPFCYSDEVWTGIEYSAAAYMMLEGLVEEGLEIVRTCRDRYDGRIRNPFDEYECGHWYARAMSSYGLLQGLTGARYDAVDKVLYVHPNIEGDFRSFLCTATGYGTVGVADGKPFLEVREGEIEVSRIDYKPFSG